ncbi:MAG TPA: hypothetical protein VM889_10810, partial [Candidatus Thermoplasmatota archaeon]|nr:hypothetical protein [Candidatus Thermoplasmatota archaeon]
HAAAPKPSAPRAPDAVTELGAAFAAEVAELRAYFQSLDAALSEAATDVGDVPMGEESARLLSHVNELRTDFESLDRRLAAMGEGVARALGRLGGEDAGKP